MGHFVHLRKARKAHAMEILAVHWPQMANWLGYCHGESVHVEDQTDLLEFQNLWIGLKRYPVSLLNRENIDGERRTSVICELCICSFDSIGDSFMRTR